MTSISYSFQSVGIARLVKSILGDRAEKLGHDAVAALEATVRRDIPGWPKERMVGEGDNVKVKEIKQPKPSQKTGFGKQGTTARFGSGAAFAVPSTFLGYVYSADAVMALAEQAGLAGWYQPKDDSFLNLRLREWLEDFVTRCDGQATERQAAKAAKAAEQLAQLG